MTHDGMPYMVLLYYKYVPIANPERFVEDHRLLCQQLGLKGRILVAEEGINGTVAGEVGPIQQYQAALRSDQRFADLEFKISSGDASTFPKLMIKVRKEIVTLGLKEDVDPNENTGTHLSPESWKQMIDEGGDEVILFDARNRYESDVGFFEGALRPEIEHFRDLPKVVDDYAHLKGKKILMYCTGGIRCEKASALFQKEGFENVYQLHGGIVSYLEPVGRRHLLAASDQERTFKRCRYLRQRRRRQLDRTLCLRMCVRFLRRGGRRPASQSRAILQRRPLRFDRRLRKKLLFEKRRWTVWQRRQLSKLKQIGWMQCRWRQIVLQRRRKQQQN